MLRFVFFLPLLLANCYTLQIARSISDPRPDSERLAEASYAHYAPLHQAVRLPPELCVSLLEEAAFECEPATAYSEPLTAAANPLVLTNAGLLLSEPPASECGGLYTLQNAQDLFEKEGLPGAFYMEKGQGADSLCGLHFTVASGRRFGLFRLAQGSVAARELNGPRPPPAASVRMLFFKSAHAIETGKNLVFAFERAEKLMRGPPVQIYRIRDREVPGSRRVLYYSVGIPTALVVQALAPAAIVVVGSVYIVGAILGAGADLAAKGCSLAIRPLRGSCIHYP